MRASRQACGGEGVARGAADSSIVGGSQGLAGKASAAERYTVARRIGENIASLEGDHHLRDFIKHMGIDGRSSTSSAFLCAAALCRAGCHFYHTAGCLELAGRGKDNSSVVRRNIATRVALIADSCINWDPRSPKDANMAVFGPSVELDKYASVVYEIRNDEDADDVKDLRHGRWDGR